VEEDVTVASQTLVTMFSIGDRVWCMFSNKAHDGIVTGIIVTVLPDKEPMVLYTTSTLPSKLLESSLYESKEALLASL